MKELKVGSEYIALYGPEARRGDIELMFGCLPVMIGNCRIEGQKLSFAHRRGGKIVPTIVPGDEGVEAMVYMVRYYQQRRLERRLGYPMGIQRGTFDSVIEDKHPCRVMAYYVPLIRPHGKPDEATIKALRELYAENDWDRSLLDGALLESEQTTPTIWRVK